MLENDSKVEEIAENGITVLEQYIVPYGLLLEGFSFSRKISEIFFRLINLPAGMTLFEALIMWFGFDAIRRKLPVLVVLTSSLNGRNFQRREIKQHSVHQTWN